MKAQNRSTQPPSTVEKAEILHVASHGIFDTDDPMRSGFELADGRFTAADVLKTRLTGMLAVLGACETGVAVVRIAPTSLPAGTYWMMGVYDTDVALAGYYMHFLEVWVGLMADVLLHTGRVTRDGAIEILIRRAGRLQHISESRVDRYIAAPGQVTCYMIGYRAVRQLRRDAERALGSRFDARAFHDVLLRDGPITLPMQRAKINRWVEDVRDANV